MAKAVRTKQDEDVVDLNQEPDAFVDLGPVNLMPVQSALRMVEYPTSDTIKPINPRVGVYKLRNSAKLPAYATEGSAAADVYCDLAGYPHINIFFENGVKMIRGVERDSNGVEFMLLPPNHRAQVPTNLKFDIPPGYKLLVYPRSGLSLNRGLNLANAIGLIDVDYVDQLYILLTNTTNTTQVIRSGERIAQIEIVPYIQASFVETDSDISQKTSRAGGLGHTGT